MQNPFADLIPGPQAQTSPMFSARPVYKQRPPQPSPQTAPQAEKDRIDVAKGANDLANAPLTRENLQTNVQQNRTSIRNANVSAVTDIQSKFRSDPVVQAWREAAPNVQQMLKARPGGEGDLSIIYGWAKVMDPTGSVREGDTDLAKSVSPIAQRAAMLAQQVQSGNFLPPKVRTGLIEEARSKAKALHKQYSDTFKNFSALAKQNGLDPSILDTPGFNKDFLGAQADYIRAHGGQPKIDGIPVDDSGHPLAGPRVASSPTEKGFGLSADPRQSDLTPEQSAAYDAWWKANPDPTPEQLKQFAGTLNLNIGNAEEIIAAKKRTGAISHDLQYKPNIDAARNGQGFGEKLDAAVRGAADTVSFGFADKAAALGDTIFNGDTFGHNLARQYAISDYDQQNHFPSRLGGQMGGALAFPMGAMETLPQAALKSGAMGMGYGIGSSRSLSEVPGNALIGGSAGSILGAGAKAAGNAFSMLRPRAPAPGGALVDQQTGELNAIMDGMPQADRVRIMKELGINTITPGMAGGRSGRIVEQVFNNLPASAGHMEDVAARASDEIGKAASSVAGKFGGSRTLNEGGAKLQRGAEEWMARADVVGGRLYNAIPVSDSAEASLSSTRATLSQLGQQFASNPELQAAMKSAKLDQYAGALENGGLSWRDLKDFRSRIGYEIGEMRLSGDSPTKDQLRALYGALSEDMKNTAAAHGGLRQFERANAFHAAKEQQIEEGLARILGGDLKRNPEAAAQAVQAMTLSRGGDLKTLAQVRAMTAKSGAWDEIAATMISLGGKPAKGEGRAFSPQTFTNWYAGMTERARSTLFRPELRKELDKFVAANLQLQKLPALNNSSNTGPLVLGGAQLLQAGKMMLSGDITGLAIQAGANLLNYAGAKLWTSPRFVGWATGYTRAIASGNEKAVRSQIGRLSKMASVNPEARSMVERLIQSANDNVPQPLAASPDAEQQQNQQYPY